MSPLSRREFVGAGIGAAAGLVIGFYLPHKGESQKNSFSPNAYLRITPDNKITIVVARSEMGQGVRTALPMILAEELEADWKQIEIEQAGASTLYGDQTTGGSASIRTTWDPMRKAGASAREMLISAAALTWGVSRSTCTAEAGHIKHAASNRSVSYGELVGKASTLPIPSDVTLKQSKDYKIVGQRLPRLDSLAKVKGEAIYGIDFRLPGMSGLEFLQDRLPVAWQETIDSRVVTVVEIDIDHPMHRFWRRPAVLDAMARFVAERVERPGEPVT